MDCIIEWMHFGDLRDIYVYGYFDSEYNKPGMIYALFLEGEKFVESLSDLKEKFEKLKKSRESWKKEDAETLEYAWKSRVINIDVDINKIPNQILLYIGKTTRYIAYRLVEEFDPGASIPLFLLNLRATDITILTGIIKPDEMKNKITQIEQFLIEKYRPLLNKAMKKQSLALQVNFKGDYSNYFP